MREQIVCDLHRRALKNRTWRIVSEDRIMILCQRNHIELPVPAEGYIQALLKRGIISAKESEEEILEKLQKLNK